MPAPLLRPKALLFDWQNTLASTMDALFHAMNDTLAVHKPDHGLNKNPLADHVKEHHRLPDYIKQEAKMSRTDIFHLIYEDDDEREKTSDTFNEFYKQHYEDVHAIDDSIEPMLREYKKRGVKLGIVTNRKREFITHELTAMGWDEIFQTVVAAGDGCPKKPSPEPMFIALKELHVEPGRDIWFTGDGKSDMQCGVSAGVGTVFYNHAKWSEGALSDMFISPGTRPDEIVQDWAGFRRLVDKALG